MLPPLNLHFDSNLATILPILLFHLDVIWILLLVYLFFVTLLRVGGDGTGEENYEEDGNAVLDNEGMPPSLIMFILCFTKLHCIL